MSKLKFSTADVAFRALLKELRQNSELTQKEVACRLKRPQSYVSKYELGERRLEFIETAEICDALGVDLAEFARLFEARILRPTKRKGRASAK